jgi:hypothetical protein
MIDLDLIKDLESLAHSMPGEDTIRNHLLTLAMQMHLCIRSPRDKDLDGAQPKSALPGQTPRGTQMPQTLEEWKYLADLYEKGMLEDKEENSRLRYKISDQGQRIEQLRERLKVSRSRVLSLQDQLDGANTFIKLQRGCYGE